MLSLILSHAPSYASVTAALYLIAAAAINALESPTAESTPRYRYLYRFLNGLPIPTLNHSPKS